MPLRLDNAKGVAHMPTAGAAKNKSFEPRFKIDHAASPMPETRQPERLAPRATSNRNGGRDHLGILGEIKSVHPGEIIGISIEEFADLALSCFDIPCLRGSHQVGEDLLDRIEIGAVGRQEEEMRSC